MREELEEALKQTNQAMQAMRDRVIELGNEDRIQFIYLDEKYHKLLMQKVEIALAINKLLMG